MNARWFILVFILTPDTEFWGLQEVFSSWSSYHTAHNEMASDSYKAFSKSSYDDDAFQLKSTHITDWS